MITIRTAHAGDRSFIEAMLVVAAEWDQTRSPLTRGAIELETSLWRYVAGWPRPGDLGVVAEADGTAIGAAWLRRFEASDAGYGFIAETIPEMSVGVAAAWRGQGIGGRLLDALFALAQAEGVEAISLSVEAENPARRLYERHGFRLIADDGSALTMLRSF